MIRFADWLGHWSVDVYLLGSVLLILALIANAMLRQPVHRLAVVKSLLVGLSLLAGLSAVPGWSVLHLMAPKPAPVTAFQVAPLTISPHDFSRNLSGPSQLMTPLPVIGPVQKPTAVSLASTDIWSIAGLTVLIGALAVLIWLAVGWAAARNLRRQSKAAPSQIQKLLQDLARSNITRKNTPTPQLFLSSRINVPVALGLRNPVIVLPAYMAESQSAIENPRSETLSILAHELAHVQNRDLYWLALSRALMILCWSQPLYWFARRRMRLDQESLADAAAAHLTSREQYAEQLVTWARKLTSAPTMRLASAVGLWEGASQLRQRVALLLDDRITILRDFSRKWQLSTLGLCIVLAATLSLITFRPSQSQEKSSTETNSLVKASDYSQTPAEKVGDQFILCPVTTELQRSLLGDVDQPLKTSLCVFVNFAEVNDDGVDITSPLFSSLAEKLTSLGKSNNELVTFQILMGPPRPMRFDVAQKRAESLGKTCEALGKSAGFQHSRSSETFFGADFDWSKYVADAESATLQAVESHCTSGEHSVGNDRVRVFAASTFLSHMLAHDTDCVVNIKPFINFQQGPRFPDDFTSELQTLIPKVKYARDNTMLVRIRFAQAQKNALDQWFEGHDNRQAFARKFGFKNCNCQTSQAAAADVPPTDAEPLKHDEPQKPATSASENPNQPKPNIVAGLALKENKEPIAAAEVFLFRYGFIDSSRKLIGQTKTSNDGRFQFDKVIDIEKEFPNGKFPPRDQVGNEFIQCIVRTSGLVPFEWMATPAQVAEQGMFRAAVMPNGNTLTGRITDSDGAPVAGALVTVGRGFGNWEGINSARTDANGNYQIPDLKPFDLTAYQKQAEEARRSASGSVFMASPESLTIEASGFATKQTPFAKIPGQQDAQLARPAVLEGRAVYAGPNQPAPNVVVQASTMITAKNLAKFQSGQEFPVKTSVRTDQAGKYRFTALPPGSYSISAEIPDWVTTGVTATDATSEKTTQLSDLTFTKGGFISARPVDSTTKQPIPLESHMHLMLIASSTSSPPVGGPTVKSDLEANAQGRFEMRAPAGKKSVAIGGVNRHDGATTWFGRLPVEANVVEGERVEIDVPVEKYNAAIAAGSLSVEAVEPKEEKTKGEKSTKPAPNSKPPANEAPPPDRPSAESTQQPANSQPPAPVTVSKPNASESPQLSLVIAKHALLLNGNELTTWEQLSSKVAALPDPSKAQLHYYFTNGVYADNGQKPAQTKIYELSRKFNLQGHSEGSLLPRAGDRYDRIEKQSDLSPDASLRVTGTVVDTKNQPVTGAEIVLIAPVDESLPYKDFDIVMVQGRIRNPLDEIYTVSDAAGHFEIYPPKGAKYRLLVAHPAFGFNLADDDSTAKVGLIPWAKLTCKLGAEAESKQTADLRTHPQNRPGYPDVTIDQYWEDLKLSKPADTFSFNNVPAILQTTISRSFPEQDGGSVSIADSSVSLLPGEDRRIELGPLNDKQREWLQFNRDQFDKLHASQKTESASSK